MSTRHAWVAIAAQLLLGDAGAQTLSLRFENGRAQLEAQDVSVQQILKRWRDQTGALVLGAEKISAPPLMLRVANVTERDLLAILLRGITGYIATERPESDGRITRIVIVDNDQTAAGAARLGSPVVASSPDRKELTLVPLVKPADEAPNRPELERQETPSTTVADTPRHELGAPAKEAGAAVETQSPNGNLPRQELDQSVASSAPGASQDGHTTELR
jgi:hypothetical protein